MNIEHRYVNIEHQYMNIEYQYVNISFKQSHIHLWGGHGGRLPQQKVDVQFLENSFLMLLSVLFSFQMLGFLFTSLNCKFLYFQMNLQHILVLVRRRPGVASLEGVHGLCLEFSSPLRIYFYFVSLSC